MLETFKDKPTFKLTGTPSGIIVEIDGDAVALAFLIGVTCRNNPEIKDLLKCALESTDAPELKAAYDGISACFSRMNLDNNN
jgi:hypothetical protein